ncbi:hypothetical protein [Modestobacter sp. NPDC049651]|uniref:hypothetical protein n=1 Tax=unclassified Modestobacter TaxID=2643866 RepID=UPI0033D944B4
MSDAQHGLNWPGRHVRRRGSWVAVREALAEGYRRRVRYDTAGAAPFTATLAAIEAGEPVVVPAYLVGAGTTGHVRVEADGRVSVIADGAGTGSGSGDGAAR